MRLAYYFDYPIDDEIKRVVLEVLEGRVHYAGKYTEGLEAGIADLCGVSYGVAANSGSSSLLMILDALGVGPGDEVIIPANAYVANAECVIKRGGRPMFADCADDTLCLDPTAFADAITTRTKAVIIVHTYGHPADMDAILEIARRRGITVIENGCHALGARYHGRPIGSFGDVAFFALSHKLLSICGMGGMTVTNDQSLATRIRHLRHHGRHGLHEHEYEMNCIGYNMRINELQAAIGYVQLRSLEVWNAQRRQNAGLYGAAIRGAGLPIRPPLEKEGAYHVYLHYVVRIPGQRDALLTFMNDHGIEAKCHYPLPNHLQPPIREAVGMQGPFPVSERTCQEVMSLPCDPNIDGPKIAAVIDVMGRFFAGDT